MCLGYPLSERVLECERIKEICGEARNCDAAVDDLHKNHFGDPWQIDRSRARGVIRLRGARDPAAPRQCCPGKEGAR